MTRARNCDTIPIFHALNDAIDDISDRLTPRYTMGKENLNCLRHRELPVTTPSSFERSRENICAKYFLASTYISKFSSNVGYVSRFIMRKVMGLRENSVIRGYR